MFALPLFDEGFYPQRRTAGSDYFYADPRGRHYAYDAFGRPVGVAPRQRGGYYGYDEDDEDYDDYRDIPHRRQVHPLMNRGKVAAQPRAPAEEEDIEEDYISPFGGERIMRTNNKKGHQHPRKRTPPKTNKTKSQPARKPSPPPTTPTTPNSTATSIPITINTTPVATAPVANTKPLPTPDEAARRIQRLYLGYLTRKQRIVPKLKQIAEIRRAIDDIIRKYEPIVALFGSLASMPETTIQDSEVGAPNLPEEIPSEVVSALGPRERRMVLGYDEDLLRQMMRLDDVSAGMGPGSEIVRETRKATVRHIQEKLRHIDYLKAICKKIEQIEKQTPPAPVSTPTPPAVEEPTPAPMAVDETSTDTTEAITEEPQPIAPTSQEAPVAMEVVENHTLKPSLLEVEAQPSAMDISAEPEVSAETSTTAPIVYTPVPSLQHLCKNIIHAALAEYAAHRRI